MTVRWQVVLMAALAFVVLPMQAYCQVRRSFRLVPGSPLETSFLVDKQGVSSAGEEGRKVPPAGGWQYALPALPGAQARLSCSATGELRITVTGADGKPLPSARQASADGFTVTVAVPPTHPLGSSVTFRFKAGGESAILHRAEYTLSSADRNGNGIPDALDTVLSPGRPPARAPRPTRPTTSFQTARPYSPDIAVPTNAVLVYSSAADVLQGWKDAGYAVYAMGGFREYDAYVREHPGEVQTDRSGRALVIGGNSYYMVPITERNKRSAAYYLEAISNGAVGVCPEEPELFARAGYSEAFKAEWQAAYGAPWTPPHTDVDSRYKSERLKAQLTVRQVDTILGAVAQHHPSVRRMLAVHSPITYSHWGIIAPHSELFRLPSVQEVIAQVWTGTARTPNRVAGIRAERTFHLAYLEYSSLVCLLRGLGKPAWMLMDPVEDNPDRTMEDYRRNYAETLVASFLFPTAERFEVMPWPDRVYGRVPSDYATVVNTIVGALSDCWRYPGRVRAGTQGLAVLVGDSMSYQRDEPHPSDFDGVYGLSLPLISHGIPLDALSLDRCADSGYLTGTRVALTSYDFQKPPSAACNSGLADWVKRGGVLMVFGGTDAYDSVSSSWWRAAGYPTPLEDLFARLDVATRRIESGGVISVSKAPAVELARGDGAVRNLSNRRRYTLDLTPFVRSNGSVCVRFEDVTPSDGWGPYVTSVELRLRDRLAASFRAGSEMETRFLAVDQGSICNGEGRFADGQSYWEYRFDNLPRDAPVTLIVEMGNGFLASAYTPTNTPSVLESTDGSSHPTLRRLRTLGAYSLTVYEPPPGATVLYRRASDGAPAVWMVKVGNGALFYCGMPPGYLTATAQTDRWMRDLVRRACAEAGLAFEPARAFVGSRGPYVAVRALTGSETLAGRYVDLLSPDLRVLEDPEIQAGQAAFLKDIGPTSAPGLTAVSGRVDSVVEGTNVTAFVVRAPEGTAGVARLVQGSKALVAAKAWDMWGRPIPVSVASQAGSVLVRYPNRADGVAVKVVWK